MTRPRRLFDLLVVGGSLWVAGCGAGQLDTGTNTSGATPTTTHPDGGLSSGAGGGDGSGSQFW